VLGHDRAFEHAIADGSWSLPSASLCATVGLRNPGVSLCAMAVAKARPAYRGTVQLPAMETCGDTNDTQEAMACQ